MRAPDLRRRVTLSGVLVLAGVLLAFNVFVYLSLRGGLQDALSELLDTRMEVAVGFAEGFEPADLVEELTQVGVPAEVRTPDGQVLASAPATPRVGQADPPTALFDPRVQRSVELPDGTRLTVFATRAGLDETLQHLLALMGLGTVAAVLLAAALWHRAGADVLAPLDHMAATAGRIRAGEAARRLDPDRRDTELGRLASAFDDMVDAQHLALRDAEAGRELTRQFLADAAHQLRTPMTGLRASAEQLVQERDPGARDRLLANIVGETARASRLVTDLLRLTRLDHEPVRRVPTDLVALCRDEAERARSLAPHLHITVDAELASAGAAEVDPDAIRDALANLLDNARRHARTTVDVDVAGDEDVATVRVTDDGSGVAAGDAERIFERFASLDDKGGSGLGLPIARDTARAHGGDLTYEDGSFALWVPTSAGPGSR